MILKQKFSTVYGVIRLHLIGIRAVAIVVHQRGINTHQHTHTHTHVDTHKHTHTRTHRADNLIILRWRCKENDKMKPSHTFATVSYHSTIKSGQDPGPSSCGIRLMAALFIPFVYLFFLLYLLRLFLLC